MSWGEETCKYLYISEAPCKPTPTTCNKKCVYYSPTIKDEEKNTRLLSQEELQQKTIKDLLKLSEEIKRGLRR